MGYWYLASPYSHPDAEVREKRYRLVCIAAAALTRAGVLLYCPIAQWHPIATIGNLPHGWEHFQKLDCIMMDGSIGTIVLRLDGWTESVGVQAEIRYTLEHVKPVEYIDP